MAQARCTPEPIIVPALKFGTVTGCSGLVFGGAIAVLRSSPTVGLFTVGSGLNCFALGSTYWAIRSTIFRVLHDPKDAVPYTLKEKVYVSGISGSLTGLILGPILRGRSNAIPGAIFWGFVGLGGQFAYNIVDARHTQDIIDSSRGGEKSSFVDGVFRSKWNPVKKLTNEQYVEMLTGKLLALDAEISITNEEIEKLEQALKQTKN